jgi:hypothetical protein
MRDTVVQKLPETTFEIPGPTICKACIHWNDQSMAHLSHEWDRCRLGEEVLDYVSGDMIRKEIFCKDKNKGNCPDFKLNNNE